MNPDFFSMMLTAISVLIIPVVGWLITAFRSIRTEIVDMKGRLAKAEARLSDAPKVQDIHSLALGLERLTGQMVGFSEKIDGMDRIMDKIDRTVSRQEKYLLDKSDDK